MTTRITSKTLAAIEEIKATDQPANDPKGVPITLAEACRIAQETADAAERKRAEIAELVARAHREPPPREVIEEFLVFAHDRNWLLHCFAGQLIDEGASRVALLDAFVKQKEKK